jgi:hypothetical protein
VRARSVGGTGPPTRWQAIPNRMVGDMFYTVAGVINTAFILLSLVGV